MFCGFGATVPSGLGDCPGCGAGVTPGLGAGVGLQSGFSQHGLVGSVTIRQVKGTFGYLGQLSVKKTYI